MDSTNFLQITATFALLISCFINFLPGTEATIGVNYGMLGNNLPSPDKVISLYKSRNITNLRLFHPDTTVLTALANSNISIILGTYNEDLQKLASNQSFANQWVDTNIIPFKDTVNFKYICTGNEVIPGDMATYVLPAMKSIVNAIKGAGLDHVMVSTAVSTNVLGVSYPPSKGVFADGVAEVMTNIVRFLNDSNSPLLVNVYPYFAYSGDPKTVSLDYALFKTKTTVVQDGSLGYTNLFDAIVDSTYFALEKVGGSNVDIVVSETGWPSGGDGVGANVENAKLYNNNVIAHVQGNVGTPKRPGKNIETYLFALFNENQKPAGTEQNFGLYQPDMTEVYHVDFTS